MLRRACHSSRIVPLEVEQEVLDPLAWGSFVTRRRWQGEHPDLWSYLQARPMWAAAAWQERFVRAYLHAADALREDAACDGAAAGNVAAALAAGVEALRAAAEAFLPVCLP